MKKIYIPVKFSRCIIFFPKQPTLYSKALRIRARVKATRKLVFSMRGILSVSIERVIVKVL